MLTGTKHLDSSDAESRLEKVTAEYRRLADSLSALTSEMAALGGIMGQSTGKNSVAIHGPHAPSQALTVRAVLLGRFQLHINGQKVSSQVPGQVRTVLRFLLGQSRRPVSKDALLDLLWPEADPAVTSSRLRVLMHSVRRSINGPGCEELVVTSGNNILINPEADVSTDVEDFEKHWHNGWRLARSGHRLEALEEYEQAESLYTGDYLEDEPYADWTLLRREALRDAYLTILTMLASMSLETSDYTGSIIWSQKLLAQDNCREDAYRWLMVSHRQMGQPARATYWYQMCVRALDRELGMAPSRETQELFDKLVNV